MLVIPSLMLALPHPRPPVPPHPSPSSPYNHLNYYVLTCICAAEQQCRKKLLCVSAVSVWEQMAAFNTGEPFVVTAVVVVVALFIPKSVVGSHFTFISDSQTVHCLSCLSSAPRLLASCAFWRWVDPPPPHPCPPPRPLWNNSECCGGCEAVARARGRASSGSPFVLAPTGPASPGCPCGRPLGVEADTPHSRYPTDTRIPGTLPLASSEATFGSDRVGSGLIGGH